MKARGVYTLPLVLTALVVVQPTDAKERPSKAPPAGTAVAPGKATAESKLVKGMAASEVQKLMGKPKKVVPVADPKQKKEVWVYRDRISDKSERVEVGSSPEVIGMERGPDGRDRPRVSQRTIYKMRHRTVDRVVAVLLVDDVYVEQKVAEDVKESFD